MKKNFIYIVISVLSFFFIINNVNAASTVATCVYKSDNLSIDTIKSIAIKVSLKDKGNTPSVQITNLNGATNNNTSVKLKNYDSKYGALTDLKTHLVNNPSNCPSHMLINKNSKTIEVYLHYDSSAMAAIQKNVDESKTNSAIIQLSTTLSNNACDKNIKNYASLVKSEYKKIDSKSCQTDETSLEACKKQIDKLEASIESIETYIQTCIDSGAVEKNDSSLSTLKSNINSANEILKTTRNEINYKDNSSSSYNIKVTSCGSIDNIPISLPRITRNFYNAVKYLLPVIIILLGMYDFLRASTSNDNSEMNNNSHKFIRRVIAGVLILLLFALVQFVFKLIPDNYDNNGVSDIPTCISCFISDEDSCGTTTTFNKDL